MAVPQCGLHEGQSPSNPAPTTEKGLTDRKSVHSVTSTTTKAGWSQQLKGKQVIVSGTRGAEDRGTLRMMFSLFQRGTSPWRADLLSLSKGLLLLLYSSYFQPSISGDQTLLSKLPKETMPNANSQLREGSVCQSFPSHICVGFEPLGNSQRRCTYFKGKVQETKSSRHRRQVKAGANTPESKQLRNSAGTPLAGNRKVDIYITHLS